ncbi:MAG: type IX secretion system sortase PorU, partial [Bacteroidota bacterium]
MKKLLLLLTTLAIAVFVTTATTAQTVVRPTFEWTDSPEVIYLGDVRTEKWSFAGAKFSGQTPSHPTWVYRFPLSGPGRLQVAASSVSYAPLDKTYAREDDLLREDLQFSTQVVREAGGYYGKVAFTPIVRQGTTYQKVLSLALTINQLPNTQALARGGEPFNSVLSDGSVYKIAINETGIHRLSYDFLKNTLGISDLDDVDPRSIRLYGNGGGLVPFDNSAERIEDLAENAIRIVGEGDGSFDGDDYILFYAEGANKWEYDADADRFDEQVNPFTYQNFYFIKTGASGNGLRIGTRLSLDNTAATTNTFDGLFRFEEELVNVMHEIENLGTGTGQTWYGDFFKFAREKDYNNLFTIPGLVTNEPVWITAEMALRAAVRPRFFFDIAGQTLTSSQAGSVPIGSSSEINFNLAPTATIREQVNLTDENVSLKLRYPHPGGAEQSSGWLDFIQLRARQRLTLGDSPLRFRDTRSLANASTTFTLDGITSSVEVWDVTNPLEVRQQEGNLTGSTFSFGAATSDFLREFIAFDTNGSFLEAAAVGRVLAQNLHNLPTADMIIVYHPDFEAAALRLQAHRETHSNLSVHAVPSTQVYNEYSSGRYSPTAIRDFAKDIFERDGSLRYLLLVGDGSFDSRDIYDFGNDFLPTFQWGGNHEIDAYPSDDYFGIFVSDLPAHPLANDLSIGVGRLPAANVTQLDAMVDKIINYDTDPDYLASWRNDMLFLGDDEDGGPHSRDADAVAELALDLNPNINLTKLHFDLFPQESTPAGDRFPDVEEGLDRTIGKGVALACYLGHGGPRGWGQERVLTIPQIQNWENEDRLAVFLTATCTFGDYDNSIFTSAGEELILNPNGGAIGLLTTTRPVYATQNKQLTDSSIEAILNQNSQGKWPTLGDVIRIAKNENSNPTATGYDNERKFTLLGDPAQRIALPTMQVSTTSINGQAVSATVLDTISALEKVVIRGQVEDLNGQRLENFNGLVFPTVFDKRISASTLGNDDRSPIQTVLLQKNVLFRGKATVTNGEFEFSFVVPKDINYEFGEGKISYYARHESQY